MTNQFVVFTSVRIWRQTCLGSDHDGLELEDRLAVPSAIRIRSKVEQKLHFLIYDLKTKKKT